MTGELRRRDHVRASDSEREQVAQVLREAVGEGRLSFEEFEERLERLYQTSTYGELWPLLSDLPVDAVTVPALAADTAISTDVQEIRRRGTRIERSGRWPVPRRLVVDNLAGPTVLDFSEAQIRTACVDVELRIRYGPTTLILPPGATADLSEVEVRWGSARSRVPAQPAPGAVHFRLTGLQVGDALRIRYRSHFRR